MTFERLQLPSQVLEHWAFFSEGFAYLQAEAREHYDAVQMQKLLCHLSAQPAAFVGLVIRDDGTPICFGVGEENTPLFSQTRTATVRAVYHRPGLSNATLLLAGAFETWCREKGIKSYTVTTKRNTGAVIRCFRHRKFGFKRPFFVFEKDVI